MLKIVSLWKQTLDQRKNTIIFDELFGNEMWTTSQILIRGNVSITKVWYTMSQERCWSREINLEHVLFGMSILLFSFITWSLLTLWLKIYETFVCEKLAMSSEVS
jgi:hypothetical protein